jgi:hypothetical protein
VRKFDLIVIAAAVVIGFWWFGCDDNPTEPDKEPFTISGVVTDAANGAPISGASIALDNPARIAGTTDSTGAYTVTGSVVQDRRLRVTVHCQAGGFFSGSTEILTTPSERQLDSVDFSLQPDLQDYLIYFADGAIPYNYHTFHTLTQTLDTLNLPARAIRDIRISPDGSLLYIPQNQSVVVANVSTQSTVTELPYEFMRYAEVSPDGRYLALA